MEPNEKPEFSIPVIVPFLPWNHGQAHLNGIRNIIPKQMPGIILKNTTNYGYVDDMAQHM